MSVKSSLKSIRPRVKLWLEVDGESILCGGLTAMLEAVHETGSIKEAAVVVGRSYRFVWDRIKQAEQAFGCQLVKTQVGGSGSQRSELTDVAVELLAAFSSLRDDLVDIVDERFAGEIARTLKSAAARG